MPKLEAESEEEKRRYEDAKLLQARLKLRQALKR